MKTIWSLVTVLLLQLSAQTVLADVKLATLFCDGVVLQRDKPVAIWGVADPGKKVSVEFQGQLQEASVDDAGKWLAKLAPLKASAEPARLVVHGKNAVTVENALVGDVWLCSGQSNMNHPVSASKDAKQEIAQADHPLIRYFDVRSSILEEPADFADGKWETCSPQTVRGFTAAGYFFAREIQPRLNVPIGIIKASLGGSPIEGWISPDVMAGTPAAQYGFKSWNRISFGYIQRGEEYKKNLSAWEARRAAAAAAGKPFTEPKPTRAWVDSDRNKPSGLYNGFIHPLEPFTLAGIIWYQGEGNAERPADYKVLFPLMIQQWRRDFRQDDLPFLFVQLPNFAVKNDPTGQLWAWQRESQAAALELPHVGMAVTIDIGDPVDLHPANKQDVGKRLALIALRQVHGRQVEDSGPRKIEVEREGSAMRVRFDHAQGLKFLGDANRAFSVAGSDRKFTPAEARIDGDSVVVSAKEVSEPVAVRMNWDNDPQGMLLNQAGLPAAPFRTDDW